MPSDCSKRMRYLAILLVLAPLLAFAANCSEQEPTATASQEPQRSIRIGLIPEQNIFLQKKRYQPLADYLSEKTGVRIELRVLSRYGNIIQNFVSKGLDGAFFGSFTAALAHRKLGVEAVARPEYPDGSSTYHGLLFVRKDSGIRNGNDMKGKRFAFVDKATTAGWLLPLYYFKTQGIRDYRSWLKESYFAGTHEGAIYDVLERNADIGAAKNTVFEALAREDPRISEDLLILARSPDVPENGLCVRKTLDEPLKRKLRETLLGLDTTREGKRILKKFGARRFIQTSENDYAVVFEYAREIGLDLETYDYMNE